MAWAQWAIARCRHSQKFAKKDFGTAWRKLKREMGLAQRKSTRGPKVLRNITILPMCSVLYCIYFQESIIGFWNPFLFPKLFSRYPMFDNIQQYEIGETAVSNHTAIQRPSSKWVKWKSNNPRNPTPDHKNHPKTTNEWEAAIKRALNHLYHLRYHCKTLWSHRKSDWKPAENQLKNDSDHETKWKPPWTPSQVASEKRWSVQLFEISRQLLDVFGPVLMRGGCLIFCVFLRPLGNYSLLSKVFLGVSYCFF